MSSSCVMSDAVRRIAFGSMAGKQTFALDAPAPAVLMTIAGFRPRIVRVSA